MHIILNYEDKYGNKLQEHIHDVKPVTFQKLEKALSDMKNMNVKILSYMMEGYENIKIVNFSNSLDYLDYYFAFFKNYSIETRNFREKPIILEASCDGKFLDAKIKVKISKNETDNFYFYKENPATLSNFCKGLRSIKEKDSFLLSVINENNSLELLRYNNNVSFLKYYEEKFCANICLKIKLQMVYYIE